MPVAVLTSEVVVMSQSMKIGRTAERGRSLRIMVGVMFVTFITNKHNNICYTVFLFSYLPGTGIRRDVFTRLEKESLEYVTGQFTTSAAISMM